MSKPKSVPLPDYPPILLSPMPQGLPPGGGRFASLEGSNECERVEVRDPILDCLDALAVHYRLDCRFSDLPPAKLGDVSFLQDKRLQLWMGLAWGMMRDFVPAFGEKKKHGRPKTNDTIPSWFHGARLVQFVRAVRQMLKEKGLPSTTPDTFEEVARILKKKPAPRWRYGKLTKPSAFKQEWKKIPRHVKKDPDYYIPLDLSHVRKTWISDLLQRDLPPIPTKLISQ